MALPYKTWEWLAPTILLTVWLVVPVVTVELFLSGIHNEVKDNLLRSKTTMKRLKSNIRIARELNESDEEDMDADLHSDKEDQALEDELRAGEAEKSSPDKADQLGIEVDVETPKLFALVPRRLLEAIATAAMRLVLDALQQVFVRNLAKDYERWVTDEGYRASRAEQSVPGPRHSSSSKR